VQNTNNSLQLFANCSEADLKILKAELIASFANLGVETSQLQWQLFFHIPAFNTTHKRRRITRMQVNT
jgi:hypothetical protein